MKAKKQLSAVTAKRYRAAAKKGKTAILDEFCRNTGYNRKYAVHILANWGKTSVTAVDGQAVLLKAGKPRKKRKPGGGRPRVYDEAVPALRRLWEFYAFPCGKILAARLRNEMAFLRADGEFGPAITDAIAGKLLAVSPRTIERRLAAARAACRLRGRSATKPGPLLKNQVPVRTYFKWDERKPGFFEIDTVAHCGTSTGGHYCRTLTVTDVFSGWTETRALLNSAHRWVVEAVQDVRNRVAFPMRGIDSDNGGEFINTQLITWCGENNVAFTRGRPYRKNDNCFVEQKNGDIVRKTVGYRRYDTEAEHAALAEVYRHTNLLVNFWHPSVKILAKEKQPNGRYRKIYDAPKTPCQRLLDSPDISDDAKAELRRRAAATNPLALRRLELKALASLELAYKQKGQPLQTAAALG